jgi:hypothetical protein
MDQDVRDQYLRDLREEYVLACKKVKTKLLDEAVKRCGLHRKVIIRKLSHPQTLVSRPRQKRRPRYRSAVHSAMAELWKMFDYPCGQRLVPLLREQVPRLRQRLQWSCSRDVADKLVTLSPKTADRLLSSERRRLQLPHYRHSATRRLLSEQIPVKVSGDWDRGQTGNLQFGLRGALRPVLGGQLPMDSFRRGHRQQLVGGRRGAGPHTTGHPEGAGSHPSAVALPHPRDSPRQRQQPDQPSAGGLLPPQPDLPVALASLEEKR